MICEPRPTTIVIRYSTQDTDLLDAQLVKDSHKPQQHRSETTDGGMCLKTMIT